MQKGKFTDDVVLLVRSRAAACAAIRIYVEMASSLGLSVNFSKTRFMMVGSEVAAEEKCPLVVADGTIDWVVHFPYLGS